MRGFNISTGYIGEASDFEGAVPAAAPLRYFVPAGNADLRDAVKNSETFAAWVGRNRYDALIFPLAAFVSGKIRKKLKLLKQLLSEHGVAMEAGGWELSSLVPRRYFFFHRGSFRMEGGRRKKDHHFCPTSLDAINILGKEGTKIFQAAMEIKVFHLWPDEGAETAWCSCPTCRAFTFQEQNRIAVNAAADVLSKINPNSAITYFEKSNEANTIPLRKNITRIDSPSVESIRIENLIQ
jgi:hypothetical protein